MLFHLFLCNSELCHLICYHSVVRRGLKRSHIDTHTSGAMSMMLELCEFAICLFPFRLMLGREGGRFERT